MGVCPLPLKVEHDNAIYNLVLQAWLDGGIFLCARYVAQDSG